MATMIFGAIGGGSIVSSLVGVAAGAGLSFLGGLIGRKRQSQAPKVTFGQHIDEIHVSGAQEGAPIRRLYGRARLGGQVIWATNFREFDEWVPNFTQSAATGKGGGGSPSATVEWTQIWHAEVSFAVAFCAGGPGTSLGRVWADGKLLDLTKYAWRFYDGAESQEPDALIEATEGVGNAPAYRGVCYLVFERMLADKFGNRIPNISAEIIHRPENAGADDLSNTLKSVCIIPGTTEFGYATTIYRASAAAGAWSPANANAEDSISDFVVSLDSLVGLNASSAAADNPFGEGGLVAQAQNASVTGGDWRSARGALNHADAASLVVSWFGDDLRAGNCTIKPKVEIATKNTTPADWEVAGYTRRGTAWYYLVNIFSAWVPVRTAFGSPQVNNSVMQGPFEFPYGTAAGVVSQIDPALMNPGGAGSSIAFSAATAPAFGGTPSDATVVEAIHEIKRRGLRCVFYPFVTIDIPPGNTLPDPYSDNAAGVGQDVFPWRGRITCSPAPGFVGTVDKTATAATQVNAFFAQYSAFVTHYANLCVAAGGVDAFIIGSELVGLTRVRSSAGDGAYPAVQALKSLAASLRAILGSTTKIGYAADWSEYHSHRPGDGTNDVIFNMDPLWSDANIDFVGIDNYLPVSDWRDSGSNIDGRFPPSPLSIGDDFALLTADGESVAAQSTIVALESETVFSATGLAGFATGEIDGRFIRFGWQDGPYQSPAENAGARAKIVSFVNDGVSQRIEIEQPETSIYDKRCLARNIEGGEYFDWHYASAADRMAQTRSLIVDTAHGEHWAFRQKDIRNWWLNSHHSRPGGVRNVGATAYAPGVKPIWFTEFGCPALDKGTNQPNVFVDPKSSESVYPYFSNGNRDDAIQRAYLETMLAYWRDHAPVSGGGVRMVETRNMFAWAYDARPFPDFPAQGATWRDAPNYHLGHWLNGRLELAPLQWILADLCALAGVYYVDFSRLIGPATLTHGVVSDGPISPRDLIEQIADALQFDVNESAGRIVFSSRGDSKRIAVSLDQLVMESESDVGYSLTRAQETDLPGALSLSFVDIYRSYDAGSIRARKDIGESQNVASHNAPVILDPGFAKELARAMLQQHWAARETARLKLPPSFESIDPGDCIDFDIGEASPLKFRIERMDRGEFLALEVTGFDPSTARFGSASAGADALGKPGAQTHGPPIVEFLDIPMLTGNEPQPWAPRVAAYAAPWAGVSVYRTVGGASTLIASVTAPTLMGELVSDFYSGPRALWDYGNSAYVQFYGDAQLFSKSEAEVFDGANAIAIKSPTGQWEILQFATAELIDTNKYKLSKLLRAQQGTEDGMANPVSAGARVIVLNPAALATLNISVDQIGQALDLRAGPATQDPGDDSYFDYSIMPAGVGLRPWSVSHLRGRRPLGFGDVEVTWARRTRFGGDAWEASDVPLNEQGESYDLEILNFSDVVLRTVSGLASPAFTYTAAMQTADWGGPQNSYPMRVFQRSAQIGRGYAVIQSVQVQ